MERRRQRALTPAANDNMETRRRYARSLRGIQYSLENFMQSQAEGHSQGYRLNDVDQELKQLNWILSLPKGTDEL